MDATCIFKRIEKKYLLTEAQLDALLQRIGAQLKPDEFGRSTVLSLYLDTPDHRIIRNSIEAADYKEKLRLRSYGTARADSTVFLELKKKYGGVVYKRRAAMTLSQAERYLRAGIKPFESQIMAELDWAMRFYGRPDAAMLIACEREAWFGEAHPDLRLTFDRNVRSRENELRLDRGSAGIRLLPKDTVLLEIKTAGAMPLWLADALDAEGILPGSFSKYGAAYLRSLKEKKNSVSIMEGGEKHVVNL
ncbi:MAG: polyphosphate polymerase domain-containing protein [Oscillospiraceae bacterium]|nr:polyphosphate polymerase domain-containing protein [Oscillospiraceae bacterium]